MKLNAFYKLEIGIMHDMRYKSCFFKLTVKAMDSVIKWLKKFKVSSSLTMG